jgi:hypothetical protein
MSDEHLPAGKQEEDQDEIRAPFSFKLMIALTVIYLGWRLIQGIVWLVERFT